MWYRVVAIASAQTEWDPRWVLRQLGDGPFVYQSMGHPQIFASIQDAVRWVQAQEDPDTFVELPPRF